MSSSLIEHIDLENVVGSSNPPRHSADDVSTTTRVSSLLTRGPLITREETLRKPWKYIGYRGYSEFLASEADFCIFRRFDVLNTRIALSLQDEICHLESKLEAFDSKSSDRDTDDINNGTCRDDLEDRKRLLGETQKKLAEYNEFMIQQATIRAYPRAYAPNVKSIKNWHFSNNNPIAVEEQEYLDHGDDLFCLASKEKTPLREFFDRSRAFRINKLWRTKESLTSSEDEDFILRLSDKRIDRFVHWLIVGLGTVMLVAPIWILNAISNQQNKLIVITVFIMGLLAMLSSITNAKPFETLGATAAYSAVLMVFMQLGSASK